MEDQGYPSKKICSGRLICDKESSVLSALPFLVQTEAERRREEGPSYDVPVCKAAYSGVAHSDPFMVLVPRWSSSWGCPANCLYLPPGGLCLYSPTLGCWVPEAPPPRPGSSWKSDGASSRAELRRLGAYREPRAGMEK